MMRSNARIAAHLGLFPYFRQGTIDNARLLRKYLGANDPNTIVARMEIGDSMLFFGQTAAAANLYDAMAKEARQAGRPTFEAYAMLRRASLDSQLAIARAQPLASATLDRLIASDVPEHRPFAEAASILKLRAEAKGGNYVALDAAIARLRATASREPQLLFTPPINMALLPHFAAKEDNWADIGFWVRPDGRTADANVLRTGTSFEGGWAERVVAALNGRRYAPLALDPTHPGSYRIERYTYTAELVAQNNSRIRRPSTQGQLVRLDLTDKRAIATPVP